MTLPTFEALGADFEPAYRLCLQASPLTKRTKAPRQQAVRAGPKSRYELRDRLLLTLFGLRVSTTCEVLGFWYDLNKTNIEDILATFALERPDASRGKLRAVGEGMDAFPEVRWGIDATGQRIQRPKNTKEADRQPPYDSGKKKAHTLKTRIVVVPDGEIAAVSDSVPRGEHP